jgi:hypothetical protein
VWNEAKDPGSHRYTFREPSPSVPADARILRGHLSKEVCIVALTEGKAEPLKKPIRVVVEGGRTSPVTLVVAEKQEILFENHDPWDHAIYEVSEKGGLTRGTMTPEKAGSESHKRTWTPPGPGVYEIRDEISPGLRSWVVVEPRTHRALFPNRKGDFDKLELDPGNYTLVAYYSGKQVATPFEVKPARGAAAQRSAEGRPRQEGSGEEGREGRQEARPYEGGRLNHAPLAVLVSHPELRARCCRRHPLCRARLLQPPHRALDDGGAHRRRQRRGLVPEGRCPHAGRRSVARLAHPGAPRRAGEGQ